MAKLNIDVVPSEIVPIYLKVYAYTFTFSAMFSKGDNFLDCVFTDLEDEVFPNGVYFSRKGFAPADWGLLFL